MKKTKKGVFDWFQSSEVIGSAILLACAVIALVVANSRWSDAYQELIHTYIGISWGDHAFKLSLEHWVGDGLMAIFFFVVGLEIKREVKVGELSSFQNAVLPTAAALGGMVVPALFYAAFNFGGPGSSGWGVPMATDIAFALGILSLFGDRVPISLKVFLTALAIVDDLGAVLVIAFFYTEQIAFNGLIVAAVAFCAILLISRLGVRSLWGYVLLAVVVWAGVLASGIHATVAGVILALAVPVRPKKEPAEFLDRAQENLDFLETSQFSRSGVVIDPQQSKAVEDLYLQTSDMRSPGLALEHALHPIQAFLILPIFALCKAGVPLSAETSSLLGSPIVLGVIAGLVVGKQVGILGACWLAIRSGKARLPEGVTWKHLWGASCLAGVGFTMSIFISDLAFPTPELVAEAKVGVLFASLVAGIIGFLALRSATAQDP